MILTRRLQDAWKVLWGRTESQAEMLRINAEWLEVKADLANIMAQINRWAARVAKQEQRAAHQALQTPAQSVVPPSEVATPSARKTALRRRAAAGLGLERFMRGPMQTPEPENEEVKEA